MQLAAAVVRVVHPADAEAQLEPQGRIVAQRLRDRGQVLAPHLQGQLVAVDHHPLDGCGEAVLAERRGQGVDDVVEVAAALGEEAFAAAIERVVVFRDELTLEVRREHLPAVAQALRDDPGLRFELCLGVCGVHYPDDTGRELHAVYPLMSITHNRRIRLEVAAPDADPHIPSLFARLPDHRLARARDLRLLRHHLRRPSRADPHRNARRLGRAPAAQGLPVGRHPVSSTTAPRSRRPTSGGPTTDEHTDNPAESGRHRHRGHRRRPGLGPGRRCRRARPQPGERIVVNMGPQHPSTHGVLRLILEIEGETITEARCGIGYLHTGIEKNLEFRNWTQGVTFVTRMDYLSPLFNETAYCLGVEKLLGVTDDIPERASVIRVMMMELNRISSHLVALATGGMELGAMGAMFYGFREREQILSIFETITGLRMNNAYIRPGGLAADLPDEAIPQIRDLLKLMPKRLKDLEDLLNENYIWKARTQGIGYLDLTGCMALGITGPVLRSTGLPHDLRKAQPYCGYETYDFDVITDDGCDSYGRYLIRVKEMHESLKIVEQCVDRLERTPAPVMIEDKKLAWPADLKLGPDGLGQLARAHRQDHGPLDGGADPPLQARHRGHPGARRPGLRRGRVAARRARRAHGLRRRHPARTACTTATRRSPTCRPWPRCARAAWSPTRSPRSRRSTR